MSERGIALGPWGATPVHWNLSGIAKPQLLQQVLALALA